MEKQKKPTTKKEPKTKQRMFYLLDFFLERDESNPATLTQIAEFLKLKGIDVRPQTLSEDIQEMILHGFDIQPKRKGNTYLYHLGNRLFEPGELQLIADVISYSKFITEDQVRVILKKIRLIGGKEMGRIFDRQICVDGRIRNRDDCIYITTNVVHEAIQKNKMIRLQYYQWNLDGKLVPRHDGKWYELSPYSVLSNNENLYLIAFDAEAGIMKNYRMDKLRNISILDKHREGMQFYHPEDYVNYTRHHINMYGGEEFWVLMRFSDELIGVVIDQFGHDLRKRPAGEGCFEIRVRVSVNDQFFAWISAFREKAKIIEPEPVLSRMTAYTEALYKVYHKGENENSVKISN